MHLEIGRRLIAFFFAIRPVKSVCFRFWHKICKRWPPMEANRRRFDIFMQFALIAVILTILALYGAGCASEEETNPPRSATEQLLLSTAADRALSTVNFNIFSGQSIYLDFTYFDSYDAKYAEGEIRDALNRAGALLMPDAKSADVIIEARSGAYSIDTNSVFFGIPAIPIPIPTEATVPVTPRVAFYERDSQDSYAKIALLAYANKSRAHIYSSGTLDGHSYHTYRSLLVISWWRTDIPEKAKKKYKQKYETWQPQYDLTNLPPPVPPESPPKH